MELVAAVFIKRFGRRFRRSVARREQLPVAFSCRNVEDGDAFVDAEFKRVAEKFARYLLEPPGERIPGACRRRRQNGLIIVNI